MPSISWTNIPMVHTMLKWSAQNSPGSLKSSILTSKMTNKSLCQIVVDHPANVQMEEAITINNNKPNKSDLKRKPKNQALKRRATPSLDFSSKLPRKNLWIRRILNCWISLLSKEIARSCLFMRCSSSMKMMMNLLILCSEFCKELNLHWIRPKESNNNSKLRPERLICWLEMEIPKFKDLRPEMEAKDKDLWRNRDLKALRLLALKLFLIKKNLALANKEPLKLLSLNQLDIQIYHKMPWLQDWRALMKLESMILTNKEFCFGLWPIMLKLLKILSRITMILNMLFQAFSK